MEDVIFIIDRVLWVLMLLPTLYIFVYVVASLKRRSFTYPFASEARRFAILFPAYMEDAVIVDTVNSFLKQDYPQTYFDVVVISDHMKANTNVLLSELPIKLILANYEDSSKAKALQLAMGSLPDNYDAVIIMDADNVVERDFLKNINRVLATGVRSIQAHRSSKNKNTNVALLDSVSEEINNSIFRRGHVNLGISSALIGSGMVFEYAWFKANVNKLSSAGEDKEMERLLLEERIYTEFLDTVYVYDEKTQNSKAFYKQRRRWLSAQWYAWKSGIVNIPKAIASWNIDYIDKLVQWMLPPRIILLGLTFFCGFVSIFFHWIFTVKWSILFMLQIILLCISIPNIYFTKRMMRALLNLPLLFVMMVVNIFRTRSGKKFIHTQHGIEEI